MSDGDDVLTVVEGARLLRIGRNALYNAIARNEVPHRRVGKQIRLSRRALLAWLEGAERNVLRSGPWSSQVAKEKQ